MLYGFTLFNFTAIKVHEESFKAKLKALKERTQSDIINSFVVVVSVYDCVQNIGKMLVIKMYR